MFYCIVSIASPPMMSICINSDVIWSYIFGYDPRLVNTDCLHYNVEDLIDKNAGDIYVSVFQSYPESRCERARL